MKRNIAKTLEDYNRLNEKRRSGVFTLDDRDQIIELSSKDGKVNLNSVIISALKAGYMIGYRAGKRHCAAER